MHIDPLDLFMNLDLESEEWSATPLVFRGPGMTLTVDAVEGSVEARLDGPGWEVIVRLHDCPHLEIDPISRRLITSADTRGRKLLLHRAGERFVIEVRAEVYDPPRGFRQSAFSDFPADEVYLDDAHDDGHFTIRRGDSDVRLYLSGCSYRAEIVAEDGEGPRFTMSLERVHDARWTGERLEIAHGDLHDIVIYPGPTPRIEVG